VLNLLILSFLLSWNSFVVVAALGDSLSCEVFALAILRMITNLVTFELMQAKLAQICHSTRLQKYFDA